MDLINVTPENIGDEHICCAISEKKGETCVADKKAWLKDRFADGLVFTKLNVRGKVFVEYIPAEKAWVPVDAPGYMHINCLWVSGQYKNQGYASALLNSCIEDAKAKGKAGITVVSSKKKMSFVADPKFFKYKGFQVADTTDTDIELLYLPFAEGAAKPAFKPNAKQLRTEGAAEWVLYYTNQCPFANTYAQRIAAVAEAHGRAFELRQITTAEEAQGASSPFTSYSLFHNGAFVTNEILSETKFAKLLQM